MTDEKRVLVYIEGEGGGSKPAERKYLDSDFRKSWRAFLAPLAEAATRGGATFQCIPGHGRGQAYSDFSKPIPSNQDALRILIVDSEGPVDDVSKPWAALGWPTPPGVSDRHCYLIVQCLETWLLADVPAVQRHFDRLKPCFNAKPIKRWPDLEAVPTFTVQKALEDATLKCKRRYGHADGNLIVGAVDRAHVGKLPAGHRLFEDAVQLIDEYCEE